MQFPAKFNILEVVPLPAEAPPMRGGQPVCLVAAKTILIRSRKYLMNSYHNSNENPNPATTPTINSNGNGDIFVTVINNNYYGGQESQKADTSGTPPNSKWRNLRNLIVGLSSLAPLIYAVTHLIKLFMCCFGIGG